MPAERREAPKYLNFGGRLPLSPNTTLLCALSSLGWRVEGLQLLQSSIPHFNTTTPLIYAVSLYGHDDLGGQASCVSGFCICGHLCYLPLAQNSLSVPLCLTVTMARSDKGAQFSDARNFTKFNDLRHRTTGAQMGMHPNPPPSPPARPKASTRATRRKSHGAGRQQQHGHTSLQTGALPPAISPAPPAPLFGHPTQAQPYTLATIPTAQPQPQHANGHIAHAHHVAPPTANASRILQSHDAQMADGVHGQPPVQLPVATGSRGSSCSIQVHRSASPANQLSATEPRAHSVPPTSTSKGKGNPGADSDSNILGCDDSWFVNLVQEAAAYLAQANVGQSTLAGEAGTTPDGPAATVAAATTPAPIESESESFIAALIEAAQMTASGTRVEEPLAQPTNGTTTAEAAVQPAIRSRVRPREDDDGEPEGEGEQLAKRVKLTTLVNSENVQEDASNKTGRPVSQALNKASGTAEASIVPSQLVTAAMEMNINADSEKNIDAKAGATAVAKDHTGDSTEKAATKDKSEKVVSPTTVTPEAKSKVDVPAVKTDDTAKAGAEKSNVASTDVPSDKAANKPASALAQSLEMTLAVVVMATDVGDVSDKDDNLDDLLRVDLDVFKSDFDVVPGKDKTPRK